MKGRLEEELCVYIQLELNEKDLKKGENKPLKCILENKKKAILKFDHSFDGHYISSSFSDNTYNITINESCRDNLKRYGTVSGPGGNGEKIRLIYR